MPVYSHGECLRRRSLWNSKVEQILPVTTWTVMANFVSYVFIFYAVLQIQLKIALTIKEKLNKSIVSPNSQVKYNSIFNWLFHGRRFDSCLNYVLYVKADGKRLYRREMQDNAINKKKNKKTVTWRALLNQLVSSVTAVPKPKTLQQNMHR